jgi:pyruvate kinase
MRRTKIIATLGPSSDDPGVLRGLVEAGLDVARLNTAHATCDVLERQLRGVREAAEIYGCHVGVMLDLGGAKLRLGEVAAGTLLVEGEPFVLRAAGGPGDHTGASVSHAGLAGDVAAGDRILIDDGRIELRVTATAPGAVQTVVVGGGPLLSRKGVNVPGVKLSVEGMTQRDLDDLAWALEAGVDLVAQSFVRCAEDIDRLREAMGGRAIPIVAKIEKHEALDDLERIVRTADIVMVARGDLGVETSPEAVPVAQRRIVAECRRTGTPVIVATQMLESMTLASRPTRAEASDVANAIFESVDAVMLSGETAVGEHPVHVLATMDRIVRAAEGAGVSDPVRPERRSPDVAAAVSGAVCDLAGSLDLAAIVTVTQSGATARKVAAHRPGTPVVAATPDDVIARRLTPVWGVRPLVIGAYDSTDGMVSAAVQALRDAGVAQAGEMVAVTGGVAVHVTGSTDFIQVCGV